MFLTITSLSNSLPSSISKLDSTSLNWAFSVCFQDTIEVKGLWGHFDGFEPHLEPSPATAPTATIATAEGARPASIPAAMVSAKNLAAQLQQDKNERSDKYLLTQKISDFTLMCIHLKKTIKKCWSVIVKEYMSKGTYAQTDLCQKFMDIKCMDKANVYEFLDSLWVKQELASVGVDIDEKDYCSTILASLPFAVSNFVLAQLAAV